MLRKNKMDNTAVAPLVVAMILGALAIVGTAGAVAYFAQPDVTYNISEGGLFSIAGLELGGLEVMAIVVGIIFVLAYLFKKK